MKTLSEKLENIRLIASGSENIMDFSSKLMRLANIDISDPELYESFNDLFKMLHDSGVKVCMGTGVGDFYLVGGGSLRDYIPNFEKQVDLKKFIGAFFPSFNTIFIPVNEETFSNFTDNIVRGYGIDILFANENPESAIFTVYFHETIHAIFHNSGINGMNAEKLPEISYFKSTLSSSEKLNKLEWLTPITQATWEEMITHIVSNRNYYNYIILRNNEIDLSKIIMAVMDDDVLRRSLIQTINNYTKLIYGTNTDILTFIPDYRKEENFMNRGYFEQYPEKRLGIEEESTNRFGKKIFITKKRPNERDISQVLQNITDLPPINFDSFDNLKIVDEYGDGVEINQVKDKIKNAIISNESKQGDTTIDQSDIVSFRESVQRYNIDPGYLTQLEIESYLFCYPSEKKQIWLDSLNHTPEEYLSSRSRIVLNKGFDNQCEIETYTVIFDGEKNNYFAIWLHGDLYSKIASIKQNQELIIESRGKEYYDKLVNDLAQTKSVEINFNTPDYTKRPFISPVSELALTFMINTFENDNRYQHIPISLTEAFEVALRTAWYKSSKYNGVKYTDIIHALKGDRLVERPHKGKDLSDQEKQANQDADINNSIEFDNAWQMATNCFSDFIAECIDDESRSKLIEYLVGFNNKFCFTELEKVPVGFTHSRQFKSIKNFRISQTQRNAIAFLNISHTGLLGYDVGVGKTLGALMAISNRFDTGNAKKALVIVPKPVYQKWINECKDSTVKIVDAETGEEKNVLLRGSLSHLNVVGIDNLNKDIVYDLKEYTDEEKKKIELSRTEFEDFRKKFESVFKNAPALDDTDDQNEPEVMLSDSGSYQDSDEKKKTKADYPAFAKNTDAGSAITLVDELLGDVNIDAFRIFGISNRENATASKLAQAMKVAYENNTFSGIIQSVYEKLGVDFRKLKDFSDIETLTHLSAICNIVYGSLKNLPDFYITTLGAVKAFPEKTIFFASYECLNRFGFKEETIGAMADSLFAILQGGLEDEKQIFEYKEKIENMLLRSTFSAKVYFEDFGFDYIAIDEAHNLKNLISNITKKPDENKVYVGNAAMAGTIKGGKISGRALVGFMSTMYVQMKNEGQNVCLLTATPFTNSPLEIYSMLTLVNYKYLSSIGYETVKKFVDDFINLKSQLSVSVDGSIQIKVETVGFNNLSLLRRIIYKVIDYKTGEEAKVDRPCKITLPLMEKTTVCEASDVLSYEIIQPIGTIVNPTRSQQMIFDALQTYLSTQIAKPTIDAIFRKWINSNQDKIEPSLLYPQGIGSPADYEEDVRKLAQYIYVFFNTIVPTSGPSKGIPKLIEKMLPPIAILKVLQAMRNTSISPFMFRPYAAYLNEIPATMSDMMSIDLSEEDPDKIIENSGKLLYTIGCIRKFNEYQDSLELPRKGFVIYSNLGTEIGKNSPISIIQMLKNYMLDPKNKMGYLRKSVKDPDSTKSYFDEVELLIGSTSDKRRKSIMKLFNEGQIKVVITTVKEGVDLQGNTIALFNLSVDWNPTDSKQIEGRAWRQGNRNGYCIVNYPLTANGSDMAIYQKLQDKTARLKAIWDKNEVKSQFDLGEWNPEQMKMSMISRMDKLAPFIYMDEVSGLKIKAKLLQSRYEEDQEIISKYEGWNSNKNQLRKALYFFTRLPELIGKYIDLKEIREEIQKTNDAIRIIEDDVKNNKLSTASYQKMINVSSEIDALNSEVSRITGEIGGFFVTNQMDKVEEAKKSIDATNKKIIELQNQYKVFEGQVEKETEKLNEENYRDIKKFKKELEKLQERFEKANLPVYGYDKEREKRFEITDTENGNYFAISEATGQVVYAEKGMSLDRIDWINVATEFDLLEGVGRVSDAYSKDGRYMKVIYEYYAIKNQAGSYSSEIDYEDISDSSVFDSEYISEIRDILGDLYLSKIKDLTTAFDASPRYGYFRLGYVSTSKKTIKRAIVNYHGVVEDRDPKQYLEDLWNEVQKLLDIVKNSDSVTSIPDELIEKYVRAASEIIKKRSRDYSNFIHLIDAFATLSELINVPAPSLLKVKEMPQEMQESEPEPQESNWEELKGLAEVMLMDDPDSKEWSELKDLCELMLNE